MQLILASNSPRRRELLKEIQPNFRVEPSLYEERERGLAANKTASLFARGKAEEVFSRFPNALVLGADTVVSLEDRVLGKPKSKEDAARMLRLLSGKTHAVFTAVCGLLLLCRRGRRAAGHVPDHHPGIHLQDSHDL